MVLLLFGLFKRRIELVKQTIKYLVNSLIFIVAWSFYFELAIIVRPPVTESLEMWIDRHVTANIYISLSVTIVLFIVNLLFYSRIEKVGRKSDLLLLSILGCVILVVSAWVAGQYAYFGMLEELYRTSRL
ncbi:hypothetical protein [Hymenobacter telluris]|uniref:hypothetical protein n=1 Tax=Hymenobacter telluris TaxID=2816474 RepID=UPI001A909502|nr:hypothetical protein [Hymenobacter telluris]